MPAIQITELWLKNAHNRATDKPVEFTHEGIDFEFGVVVNPPSRRYPKGTKSWFTRYAWPGTKRGRREPLGRYPTVKLSEALEAAKKVQRTAGRGDDPRTVGQPADNDVLLLFGELFEKYFEERSLAKTRPDKDRSAYGLYLSDWAKIPTDGITRTMARERFKEIVVAGKPAQANMVQFLVSAVFNWALDEELVDKNPIHRLALQGEIGVRDRLLSDEEIRRLLRLLGRRDDVPANVLHLMLLTGQRRADIQKMQWAKIEDGCWWFLPGKIELPDGKVIPGTKNGKNHMVYLNAPALVILERLKARQPGGGRWVFPNQVKHAFREFSTFYSGIRKLRKEVSDEDWKPHDLRRTVVTNLSRLGCSDKIKMAIVNHSESHVHKKVYDKWTHAPEKMHWMAKWADFLRALESGEDTTSLLPYAGSQPSAELSPPSELAA